MSTTTSTPKPVAARSTDDSRKGRPIRIDSIKGFSERVRRELDQRSRAKRR